MLSRKMKVAVSACLLGNRCRYDGATKQNDAVIQALKGAEVVPFCPEEPVLGVPRERISIVWTKGLGYRLIGDVSGNDITQQIKAQTQKLIDQYRDLDKIILKSKSPSCGISTAPVVNAKGEVLCYDNGIAAQMLLSALPTTDIVDEKSYTKT